MGRVIHYSRLHNTSWGVFHPEGSKRHMTLGGLCAILYWEWELWFWSTRVMWRRVEPGFGIGSGRHINPNRWVAYYVIGGDKFDVRYHNLKFRQFSMSNI